MTEQGQAQAPANNFGPLTIEDLESLKDQRVVAVVVPEWQRVVYLRSLPADQGLVLAERLFALPEGKQTEAIFVILSECFSTPTGGQFFPDAQQARAWMGQRDVRVLGRLQDEAMKIMGWEKAKSAALKNVSGEAAAGASPIA
jgi:hypothetical protein